MLENLLIFVLDKSILKRRTLNLLIFLAKEITLIKIVIKRTLKKVENILDQVWIENISNYISN